MTRPHASVLLVLVAIGAAGLIALPYLWHGFSQYEPTADIVLAFGAGWLGHANRARSRPR